MHTSGRRQETVEVLKQKYMNNEIHDLPRVKHGSMSRSTSLLDSRKQLSKVKSSQNNTGRRRYFQFKKTGNNPTVYTRKSVEAFLYGEFADDIDPELAALFEKYVIECDASSRRRARDSGGRLSDFVVCVPTAEPSEDSSSPGSPQYSDSGVEETNFSHKNRSEILLKLKFDTGNSDRAFSGVRPEAAVKERLTDRRDVTAEAVMDAKNIRSLITRTQNVTHRHLTDWELQSGKETGGDIEPFGMHNQDENDDIDFTHHMRSTPLPTIQTSKWTLPDHRDNMGTQKMKANTHLAAKEHPTKCPKCPTYKDAYSLHVGKAHEPETLVGRMNEYEITAKAEAVVPETESPDGQTESFDKGDTAEKDGHSPEVEVPFTRHRVISIRPKPKAEVRPLMRESNILKDLTRLDCRSCEEEELSNFRLAKRKIEHRLMTSLVFEESIIPQAPERQEHDEHRYTGRLWRNAAEGRQNPDCRISNRDILA